ncbi:MAG: xanthine dehydrogenase small subunit [Hyphomicrobiales bacterium]|nr:xanthine dehydrogenase small subunit [Hyphomicrobiales bacterium]
MSALQFVLNGKPVRVDDAPPTMTVLDWLRGRAGLIGTKEGCAEGDCGACTVLLGRLDGGGIRYQAVNACLMMLPQLHGCAVRTVEGVAAADGSLHPVQQALIDTHATQCGFCTPGFVMAMLAFSAGGERLDDDLIHEALAGNLCRCTGYRSIVEACRRLQPGVAIASPEEGEAVSRLGSCEEYVEGAQVFLRPRSLSALLHAAAAHPDALLLGGGTDLGLRVSKERAALPAVIATSEVAELRLVEIEADALVLGGAVTYTEALPHLDRHFPAFGALVRRIGSRQIRNLGTIAGNLATASPIGDTIPCLLALDAAVTLGERSGERTMPISEFIVGYRRTALAPGEVITAIRIPLLAPDHRFTAYKLSKRFDQDISTVVAAFRLGRRDGKVSMLRAAYGGMADRAMRAAKLEAAIVGRPWTPAWLADVDELLARDFAPMSDHRGGANYRLRVAANLLRRFQMETTATIPVRVEAL